MASPKTPQSVDQLEILRGLVAGLAEQGKTLLDTVDSMREESRERHVETRADILELGSKLNGVLSEVDELKARVSSLHSAATSSKVELDELRLKVVMLETELQRAKEDIARIRTDRKEDRAEWKRVLDDALADQKTEREAMNASLSAITNHLGLSSEKGKPAPPKPLEGIQKWQKQSRTVQVLTVIGIVVDIIHRLLTHQ